MDPDGSAVAAVEVVVVTDRDVVTAYETNLTTDRHAVLRLTPPYRARMRGRLHRLDATIDPDDGKDPGSGKPISIPPAALLTDPPERPTPAETATALRADSVEYTRERHRERHVEAMTAWRDEVAAAIADRVSLATPAGMLDARVATLAGDDD